MLSKKIGIFTLAIFITLLGVSCVSAATYSVSNSTDVEDISKIISGDSPMKNGKFIKNGDIIKFKEGNYYGINLTVKKNIKLTTTKNSLGKVKFIGNGKGTSINIKSKKAIIYGFGIKNYEVAIKAKTNNSIFSKLNLYKNGIELTGTSNKLFKNKFILSPITIYGKSNKIYYNYLRSGNINILGHKNTLHKNLEKEGFVTVSGSKNRVNSNRIEKSGLYIDGKLNKIYKNKIYKASITGIGVYGSKNLLEKNIVYKTQNGMDINGKKHSIIKNKISNCKYGIIYQDKSNTLKNNIFKNNRKNKWYNPPIFPE